MVSFLWCGSYFSVRSTFDGPDDDAIGGYDF